MKRLIDEELIGIGRIGIIQEDGVLVGAFPHCSSHAYKIHDEERISKYSDEEIISLFKGLVIAEKELHWHCGSTSPAAHVYQIITSKQLDPEYLLADWAFQFSDNEYVPFGFIRHGERTAHEYINWRNEYQNRLIQERLDKEERKRQKQARALEIKKKKEAIDERNRQKYQKIFQMSPIKQVDYIVNDDSHNLLFYTSHKQIIGY